MPRSLWWFVCCDGCPHVHHCDFVPKGSSRDSLEKITIPGIVQDGFHQRQELLKRRLYTTATNPASCKKKSSTKRAGTDQVDATEETEEETKIESVYFECNEKRLDLQKCESRDGWIHFPSCHPDGDDFEGDE